MLALVAAVTAVHRRELRAGGSRPPAPTPPRLGLGLGAVAAATLLVLLLARPAAFVLALGVLAAVFRRLPPRRARAALDARTILALLAAGVALGTLGRAWSGPGRLVGSLGGAGTAGLGAVAAVCLNNLPAAVLLSSQPPAHPRALLLGLDLGPNLAVTGSLSAVLWLRAARLAGAKPSTRAYSRVGALVTPLTLAAALAAGLLQQPPSLHFSRNQMRAPTIPRRLRLESRAAFVQTRSVRDPADAARLLSHASEPPP